jgi:hypothetical protein
MLVILAESQRLTSPSVASRAPIIYEYSSYFNTLNHHAPGISSVQSEVMGIPGKTFRVPWPLERRLPEPVRAQLGICRQRLPFPILETSLNAT